MRNLLNLRTLVLAGVTLTATPAMAIDFNWVGFQNSSWGTGQNWAPGLIPGAGDTVTFASPIRPIVNLGTDRTVDAITFGTPAHTLNSSSETLTVEDITVLDAAGTVTHTINADVVALSGALWEINGNERLVVAGNLSGSTGISKRGTGRLTLSGSNGGYTGNITVYDGELRVGLSNSLSDSTNIGLQADGTLRIVDNEQFGGFTGLGSVILDASGNVGHNDNNAVFNGVISGSGPLFKGGTGTLTLGGANTYAGVTEVRSGTLKLNNTSGSATGSGAVEVQSGTTLTGNGSSSGTVTVLSGTVVPGDGGVGTLDLGGVTLDADSTLIVELGGASNHDVLNVTGTATLGGTLDLSSVGGYFGSAGEYLSIVTASSVVGTFSDVVFPDGQNWLIEYNANEVRVGVCGGGDCNGNGIQDDCDPYPIVALDSGPRDIIPITPRLLRSPIAVDDAVIEVVARHSLEFDDEYAEVSVDGTFVARVFQFDGLHCGVNREFVVVDKTLWNSARDANDGRVPIVVRYFFRSPGGCSEYRDRIYADVPVGIDSDDDGILDACEFEDCDGNGIHDPYEWDADGDSVIDACDQCPGFDDNADLDGDGIADGCDPCDDRFDADGDGVSDDCEMCPGFDDNIDCNGDGFPDKCQLDERAYTDSTGGLAECTLPTLPIGSLFTVPATITDVQLTVENQGHNVDEVGESMDIYANDVLLGTLFADAAGCDQIEVLTIAANDWNTLRSQRPGDEVEFMAVRNAASCAGSAPCFLEDLRFTVDYMIDPDMNDNGWLDECTPDCNPDDVDSDGDGVPDNCDACPNTIADGTIVDAYGCPIHLSPVDADGDGDVEADDFAALGAALQGPGIAVGPNQPLDWQRDDDLDMTDVSLLQRCVRGRDVAADPASNDVQLPLYRLIEDPAWRTWVEADIYTKAVFGTHMAVIDETLAITPEEQLAEMRELAAQNPISGTWFGLYFSSCPVQFDDVDTGICSIPADFPWPRPVGTKIWTWSNGTYFDYDTQLDCFADDPASPDPTPSQTFFSATMPGSECRWQNFTQWDRMRSFLAQLPPSPVTPMPTATTETVNLYLDSSSDGLAVAPSATIDWTIEFDVSTGDNAGLALLVTDLTQDSGNPELFDLPQADSVPAAMSNFAAPAGISNPAENGASSGYVGVQRGTPGALNLVQIGGGQNNLGAPLPGGQVGQTATAVGGVGQSGRTTLASGSFTAPSTPGTYVFRLANSEANVFTTVNAAPGASPVVEPNLDLADNTITVIVVPGCVGDTDDDGDVDLSDLALVLSQFGMSGAGLAGDVDSDGDVDLSDLATVLGAFGGNC